MPKLAQGPHLFKRKARYDKDGKLTHRGTFFIIDGKQLQQDAVSLMLKKLRQPMKRLS